MVDCCDDLLPHFTPTGVARLRIWSKVSGAGEKSASAFRAIMLASGLVGRLVIGLAAKKMRPRIEVRCIFEVESKVHCSVYSILERTR